MQAFFGSSSRCAFRQHQHGSSGVHRCVQPGHIPSRSMTFLSLHGLVGAVAPRASPALPVPLPAARLADHARPRTRPPRHD